MKSDVDPSPDPEAKVTGSKATYRSGSKALITNVPAKWAVPTALAIPPADDASADAVSKPGPPMAPAVAMFNAPTESAEAETRRR